MVYYCLIVLMAWLLDILLGFWGKLPLLYNSTVPFLISFSALALNFTVWFLLLILPCLLIRGLVSVGRLNAAARSITMVMILGSLWCFSLVYLFSWAIYGRIHYFLGLSSLQFLERDFSQFLLHLLQVEQKGFYLLLFASLVLTAFFVIFGQRLHGEIEQLKASRKKSFLGVKVFTLLLVLLGSLSPELLKAQDQIKPRLFYYGSNANRFTRAELFQYLAHYQTGPLTRIVFDSFEAWSFARQLKGQEREAKQYLTLEPKRILSMEDYLKNVPKDQLKNYNVIILLVESMRSDCLKPLGAKREIVPNLDKLAAESLLFSQAFSQSSHSNCADLCTLNSQYPLRELVYHYYPPNKYSTYPRVRIYDILKGLGYKTAIFSSQNEKWGGMLNYLDTGDLDMLFHSETFKGRTYFNPVDPGFFAAVKEKQLKAGKVEDHFTVDNAMKWIETNKGEPFFMYMNIVNSHFPYQIPQGFDPPFKPYRLDFPISFAYYPKDKTETLRNRYDSSLFYMDTLIGKFLDKLKELGLFEKTILVVSGDNGEMFHEHDQVTHASALWNPVLHVPMIIHAPGQEPALLDLPAQHIDIPPTVLGLMGIPPHPSFQGRDVLKEGEALRGRDMYFLAQTDKAHQSAMISAGRYKMISDWLSNNYLLFDLEKDPGELRNIQYEKAVLFKTMRTKLDAWKTRQLIYYGSLDIHKEYYPPSFDESADS